MSYLSSKTFFYQKIVSVGFYRLNRHQVKIAERFENAMSSTSNSASIPAQLTISTSPTLSITPSFRRNALEQENVSYKFTCYRCDSVYTGKSYSQLCDRMKENTPAQCTNQEITEQWTRNPLLPYICCPSTSA